MRTVLRSAVVLGSIVVLAACASSTEEESIGSTEQAASGPQICPAIAILCIQGYHPETRGNCKQFCVKDHGPGACTPKCGKDEYCSECRTVNGSGFFCLPNGAVC